MCIRRLSPFALSALLAVGCGEPRAVDEASDIAGEAAAAYGHWFSEPSFPVAIQETAVTALDGRVYVFGGSKDGIYSRSAHVFDPETRAWSELQPFLGRPRDHIGAVAARGGVYLVGGLIGWPGPGTSMLLRYDPSENTWAELAPMPTERGAAGVAVVDGKIYAAGGLRDGVPVADFAAYDPVANTWESLPDLPTARDHLTAVGLGGKLYAMGGRDVWVCAPKSLVEVYDPGARAWSTAPDMPTPRGGFGAAAVNGRIVVFGGEGVGSACGVTAHTEEFDPSTETWRALDDMPTPRHGTGAAVVGEQIHVPTGATSTGTAASNAHERLDLGGPALDRRNWTASASSSAEAPSNAIDGNGGTRWSTGAAQAPGQYFQIDLKAPTELNRIELDAAWSPDDRPTEASVAFSLDGVNWEASPVRVAGAARTTIRFATRTARFVRIEQTGSDAFHWWSIVELDMHRDPDVGAGAESVVASSASGEGPRRAIDQNPATRWSTGAPQTPGQSFEVDLGAPTLFNRIVMDAAWSALDYPRAYEIFLSQDGVAFGEPVAAGAGVGAVTAIDLPLSEARHVRIVQTGSDPGYWWSIHELTIALE